MLHQHGRRHRRNDIGIAGLHLTALARIAAAVIWKMPADQPGGPLSCLWPVLYDDHYVPDHRGIPIWTVSLRDPSGVVLCPLYSGTAEAAWRDWNLLLPAGGGPFDDPGLRVLHQAHEANRVDEYGSRFTRGGRAIKIAVIESIRRFGDGDRKPEKMI